MPRFIIFLRASKESDSTTVPKQEELQAMTDYNASLVNAGILHSCEGLHPSSNGSQRITFHNTGPPTVQSGPFPTNEIVSGWWIVKVTNVEEAVEWAKKCPITLDGGMLEIRKIAESCDFGDAFSPELQAKEEEMRKKCEENAKSS